MKNILHYGLQRSGTNFLETLLLQNFKIRVLNSNEDRKSPLQKHFRLYDEKHFIADQQYTNELVFSSFSDYMNSMNISEPITGMIIISKDPYSWLVSYEKWAKKCNWPPVSYNYIEEYNRFYRKWMEFSQEDEKIIFVKYVNLLLKPKQELHRIRAKFALKYKIARLIAGKVSSLERVAQSDRFSEDRRAYYIQKRYLQNYTEASIGKINKIVDLELMDFLGYEVIGCMS